MVCHCRCISVPSTPLCPQRPALPQISLIAVGLLAAQWTVVGPYDHHQAQPSALHCQLPRAESPTSLASWPGPSAPSLPPSTEPPALATSDVFFCHTVFLRLAILHKSSCSQSWLSWRLHLLTPNILKDISFMELFSRYKRITCYNNMDFYSLDPVAPNLVYKLTAIACSGFSLLDVYEYILIFFLKINAYCTFN